MFIHMLLILETGESSYNLPDNILNAGLINTSFLVYMNSWCFAIYTIHAAGNTIARQVTTTILKKTCMIHYLLI